MVIGVFKSTKSMLVSTGFASKLLKTIFTRYGWKQFGTFVSTNENKLIIDPKTLTSHINKLGRATTPCPSNISIVISTC